MLDAARSALWIPVSQSSYRELSLAAFKHLHSVSLNLYLSQKTSEVSPALGKGSSISASFKQVTFLVVRVLLDSRAAVDYFWSGMMPTTR